ncbi:MAG TPA: DUF6600 domain-containing protein [Candidatus Acidoferrum sp.]|nr:DUF6600 domain-containing protein [Candidatus Acidoferrum sp.]
MNRMRWLFPVFVFAVFFSLIPGSLRAQDQNQSDPPTRVARLGYMDGSVSYQVSGDQNWVDADMNRPLAAGDNLWADKDSRAEFHISSTAVRMSSETGVSFLTLDDRTVQLQLAQGTIEVHVRNLAEGEAFEIDTPNVAFSVRQSGEYVLQTSADGNSTSIIVREGAGQATGGGESYDLAAGQEYSFNGTDQLAYNAQPAPGFDDFENWCQQRDQRENDSASAQYVSRDIDGYYDLDGYGSWQTDPDYGAIWYPSGVAVGWVPYRNGHWVWIAPWGWSWVESEPWGFAPFHYGRWAYVRGYWGWVPGPVVVRPVYSPALVAFVGGGGLSLSVSFGGGFTGVGWYPLGPRDVWVPGYPCSQRYFRNVNVTNTRIVTVTQVTNVYNITRVNNYDVTRLNYTYARNNVAVTAVSRDTFVNARPVAKSVVHVQEAQLDSVRVDERAPLQPTRSSYISPEARVTRAAPKVPFSERPVTARLAPATPVNRPVYTNDSREFNQEPVHNQPETNAPQPRGQVEAQTRANNEPSSRTTTVQPHNDERGFTAPPTRAAQSEANRPVQQNQPQVRYTPPVRARDSMYDVHPPLNQPRNNQAPSHSNSQSHGGGSGGGQSSHGGASDGGAHPH